jgi:hypothetical protein
MEFKGLRLDIYCTRCGQVCASITGGRVDWWPMRPDGAKPPARGEPA